MVFNPEYMGLRDQAMQTSIEKLISQATQGSREALEEVLHRIQDPVYAIALRMLFHPADAEDATQEILIKVITHLEGFRFEGPFLAWVLRIAANHLKADRKSRVKKMQHMTMDKAQEIIDRAEARGWFARPMEAPEPILEAEMRSACTQALLQALDREHRLAFVLGAIIEVSSTEGAYIQEISPEAFRKRLSRARLRIKDFLSANCGFFGASNRCNCTGVLVGHVQQGWIDPQRPVFVAASGKSENPIRLRSYLKELDELSRITALYKSVLDSKSSTDFAAIVKTLVEEKNYRILSDPQVH